MDLRLQIDRLEEAVFQAQQQREEQTSMQTTPPARTTVSVETERTTQIQAETIRRLETDLDQERSRASEMEADYQRRVASVQGLSPGKSLEQVCKITIESRYYYDHNKIISLFKKQIWQEFNPKMT